MSGTMYELCGSFAYLHRLWLPACLTPRLGREMRYTYNIRLIHSADTTILETRNRERVPQDAPRASPAAALWGSYTDDCSA